MSDFGNLKTYKDTNRPNESKFYMVPKHDCHVNNYKEPLVHLHLQSKLPNNLIYETRILTNRHI